MAALGGKKTWRIFGVILAVAVIITGLVLILDRANDGTVESPEALRVTVVDGDREIEVKPYRVCDLFAGGDDACRTYEDAAAAVDIDEEETVEVTVPDAVSSMRWTLQRFYTDETVNAADAHEPGEKKTVTVAGSASVNGQRTPLGVMEISTAVVGRDASGEETTYGITWSIANDAQ